MSQTRALLSLDEALERLVVAGTEHALHGSESVPTMAALGRVLAEPVQASLDVPPADNTSMDGYALRAADVPAVGAVLPVSQRIPAGVVGAALAPGSAARVFTGAQLPAGADAVVMQEQCEALPAGDEGSAAASSAPAAAPSGSVSAAPSNPFGRVRVNVVPGVGQWVRRRGEDVRQGSVVLAAGARLTPQALGLAATVGAATLRVRPQPRVALFSTGDELAMPGEALKPGAIYNSNRFTLSGLLQAAGCRVQDLGIVPDRLEATREALRAAASAADLILTSGGVSVGEEDHIRPAVASLGSIAHWQLAIKPGKPLALGSVRRDDGSAALFIGLPGNPVSSFVTFLLCVAPVLRAMQGMPAALGTAIPVRAGFDWPRPDKRREFLRVRLNAEGVAELFGNQSSGVLTSTVWADGLVDNPAGGAIARGDWVAYRPLSALIGG